MIKLIKSDIIPADFRYTLKRLTFLHPDGKEVERDQLEHGGSVVIIPEVSPGQFLLVKQYRHVIEQEILEFPAGTLEPDEDPKECALRELQEEVGHKAAKISYLGPLYPSPGFCTEKMHCFHATELSPSKLPTDEDEVIEPVQMSKDDITNAIKSNDIIDGKTMAVWARLNL